MKKHEREIERYFLSSERDTLKELEDTYHQAILDVDKKLAKLNGEIEALILKDPENETLVRSKIYQKRYQTAIKEQITNNLNVLKDQNVKTVQTYMAKMYEDGYLANIYSLNKYGVPVVTPINQELLLKALTYDINNIPLSKRLYDNVEDAKRRVLNEVTRGFASGMSVSDIARNIENSLNVSRRKANQIAQNEGARVRLDATIDAARDAKEKGADLVKQWDATLDGKTRPVHRELHNQYAELDEPFHSSAGDVMQPKGFGKASQDINCRCALLIVPRWDVEDEAEHYDQDSGELIKASSYADWKKKYYNQIESETVRNGAKIAQQSRDAIRGALDKAGMAAIIGKAVQQDTVVRNYDNEIAQAVGKEEYNAMMDTLENAENEDVRALYARYLDTIKVGSTNRSGVYSRGRVNWNLKTDSKTTTLRKKHSVFYHEAGHAIDDKLGSGPLSYYSTTYKDGLFPKTIKAEVDDWVDSVNDRLKAEFNAHKTDLEWLVNNGFVSQYTESNVRRYAEKYNVTVTELLSGKVKLDRYEKSMLPKYSKSYAYKHIENEVRALTDHQKHALSDILEGATKAKIQAGWGHGKTYWNSIGVEIEAFAEMLEANISGPESLEMLKKYLPKSVKVFDQMIKDAIGG